MDDTRHDDGIHTIDTHYLRPSFDAAHLVVQDGRAAFVDCGTAHSVPHLLAALTAHGLAPTAVDWLLLPMSISTTPAGRGSCCKRCRTRGWRCIRAARRT